MNDFCFSGIEMLLQIRFDKQSYAKNSIILLKTSAPEKEVCEIYYLLF